MATTNPKMATTNPMAPGGLATAPGNGHCPKDPKLQIMYIAGSGLGLLQSGICITGLCRFLSERVASACKPLTLAISTCSSSSLNCLAKKTTNTTTQT